MIAMLFLAAPAMADSHAPVSIIVNLGGRSCTVQNRLTACMTLPDLLERELRIDHRAVLSISAEGCDREAMSQARTVANYLKAAGFTRAAVVGFMGEPKANCAP
jgi:hypothetical protein